MPIERMTINRAVWSKFQTQTRKFVIPEYQALVSLQRASGAPNGDTILWEPNDRFLALMRSLLKLERGFMREGKEGTKNLDAFLSVLDKKLEGKEIPQIEIKARGV